MRDRNKTIAEIIDTGVIAIIRLDQNEKIFQVIDAIQAGGIRCIEISMSTPNTVEFIKEVSQKMKDKITIGAGTVLDPETARLVILAGAEFIVTPTMNIDAIKMAHRYDKVAIPGALTPTEILNTWEHGADFVKVFPASLGGPRYIKDIRAPLPQIRLVPTGGVNLENAVEFIRAGAASIAIGSALVDKKTIIENNFSLLTQKSMDLVQSIKNARKTISI